MKSFAGAVLLLMLILVPCQTVFAQNTEMPVPGLVVKDADGKVMGQVAGFWTSGAGTTVWPVVALRVDGKLAYLVYRPYGLIDRVASNSGDTGGGSVYFSDSDCVGDAYVNQVSEVGLEGLSGNMYGVGGPDPITGEYKLYRSTTFIVTTLPLSSKWQGGSCINFGPSNVSPLAAEEVIPNPLAGFHGPTTANPERILTIDGGDGLP